MNASAPIPRRFTSREFERSARSGGFGDLRVELRRGWIVEMRPQYAPHAALKAALYDALRDRLRGSTFTVWSEVSVAFSDGFQPMPDIVVFDPGQTPQPFSGPIPGPVVRLVIEAAATTLKDDFGDKRDEYAQAGFAEYWVADVAARVLHRHAEPSASGYGRIEATPLSAGAASWTLPGLALAPL